MKIAEVKVNGTTCDVTRLAPISKGLVGATVSIEYTNAVWDGLQKTVVFRSSVTKDVLVTGSEVVIPAEVVSRAGVNLYMGVYGVDATNNVVIPTIWAELGMIQLAATPSGDTSIDPTLPVWAQIQGMIGNLDDLDTDAKSSLVAAVNEALTKGGGEIDPAEVQKIVEDYLKENPPSSNADISLGLTAATVGQTIKVKAVDADGKPTEWEAVNFPAGDSITAPLDVLASGTIPAGLAAWTHIGDTGLTWGDLRKYKSIGIGFSNGTDSSALNMKDINDSSKSLQIGMRGVRTYTILEAATPDFSKVQFRMSASGAFWIESPDSANKDAKWYSGANVGFNPGIITHKFNDSSKLTLFLNNATTVESVWWITGLTK